MGTCKVAVTTGGEPTAQPAPLRICYLLQQFPLPTETFAVSDISALLAQGHVVSVYTVKRPRRHEARLLAQCGVPKELQISRATWAGARTWPKLLWRLRSTLPALLRSIMRGAASNPVTAIQALLCVPRIVEIAAAVDENDVDVVHAFWARHVGLVLSVLRAKGARAVRTGFVGAYDLVADDFLVDMTLGAAEIIFSHAEVNRPYLERKAPVGAQIEIIRRGIPLPKLADDSVRQQFQWITASSLIPDKNVEAVLRAFATARHRERRLTLKVFGEGPDRSNLEGIARELGCSDVVTFAGHVRRDELFAEMQRASVFLLLSKGRWERLPNVLKEALWAGCAVISSNSPGIEELISDRRIGFVVDPDDQDAIAAAVTAVLDCTDLERAERRQSARAHVAEHFSAESSMLSYAQAWELHSRHPALARAEQLARRQ